MPQPSSTLATLRPDLAGSLEEFDLEFDRQGFIGLRAAPVFEVARPAGTFGIIPVEQLLEQRETKRGAGGNYNRSNWKFEEGSFATAEHGAEDAVDDNEAKIYAEFFDAEVVTARRVRDVVLRNQEKRIAALLFNTTTWTGASLTTAVSTPWSTIASAVPLTDIDAAKRKVWAGTGLWPNALILTRSTFMYLRRNAQIVDLCKAQGFMDVRPGKITTEQLATALDLPHILVAGSAKNTGNKGQGATIASVWTDTMAMVCRIAETNDVREPCVARTFHYGEDGSEIGGVIESYREEAVRGDVVRVRHQVQEKVMYTALGHLLTSVAA